MLRRAINDQACLDPGLERVQQRTRLTAVQQLAKRLGTTDAVARHLRMRPQRDDTGDPNDEGPFLACNVPQRMRLLAPDPNCLERTFDYLTLAEILDPRTERTAATIIVDGGWHTFPVEFRNGIPSIVVLDPIATPPRNAMLSAMYDATRVSPADGQTLPRWFRDVARNACFEDGGEFYYQRAIGALRNGLTSGEPVADSEDLDYIVEVSAGDAELWGVRGRAAHEEAERSIRNFLFKLDTGQVSGFLDKLTRTAEQIAPHALKAALVAEFGPAAAIALQGVDLAMAENAARPPTLPVAPVVPIAPPVVPVEPARSAVEQAEKSATKAIDKLRHMSLAFRQRKSSTPNERS